VTIESATRPQRVGDDTDDEAGFVMSLPETRRLFDGTPADTVAAATAAVQQAFATYAGPRGVVVDGTAWLVTAQR
jgi:hypothetical protein